jgi:hypothetical protein
VHLDKWNVYAVARYAEVHAVLNDPLTFCSGRGVGLSDFAKEKPPIAIRGDGQIPIATTSRARPAVMSALVPAFICASAS